MSDLVAFLTGALGAAPRALDLYTRALTHGSHDAADYQRLEFLGDRVLNLCVAELLYHRYVAEAEGSLAKRHAALVSGATCADVARSIGVVPFLRLGKQARDDGAAQSDNVLGDVTEALIGALYLDHGLPAASAFIERHWLPRADTATAPRHPKSALQEWAAEHRRKPPVYELVERSGSDHAPRFTVRVTVPLAGCADGSGLSKQEAQTAAAAALLERLTTDD